MRFRAVFFFLTDDLSPHLYDEIPYCSHPEQDSIWHWAVARLLLILWEHDLEIIRHAHDLSTDDEVC